MTTSAKKKGTGRENPRRTIAVVARDAGVNVETVRFYERQGILRQPTARDGWRVYGEEAVLRIVFVQRAQQLGFTLREAKELLRLDRPAPSRCQSARRAAEQKIREIDARVSDLRSMRRALGILVERCASGGSDLSCPLLDSLSGAARKRAAGAVTRAR